MPQKKHSIIFDFDGVLADSFMQLYRMNRAAMELIGWAFSQQDYRNLFLGNVHDQFNKKINPAHIKKFREFKSATFKIYYSDVQLFAHSKKLIQTLSKTAQLSVVSSTPGHLISNLLQKNNLKKYFKIICGSNAASKENELKKAIGSMKSEFASTYFITDSVGDVHIGKKLNLLTCAVGWGFHHKKQLLKSSPNVFFDSPEQIITFLKKNPL